jgi:hypothetical protein
MAAQQQHALTFHHAVHSWVVQIYLIFLRVEGTLD